MPRLCEPLLDAQGRAVGIVCRRVSHRALCQVPGCNQAHHYECDYPVKRAGQIVAASTCDMKLCASHRTPQPQIGKNIDYCPAHDKLAREARLSAEVKSHD